MTDLEDRHAAYLERISQGPPWGDDTRKLGDAYHDAADREAQQLDAMRSDHPRWREFIGRLSVAVEEHGCRSGKDKSQATAVLAAMDVPMCAGYFEAHGGFCDCEILMNVAWRER